MEVTAAPVETTARRARVLLVDDHPSFCLGLSLLLGREPDLEVVASAVSAAEALVLDARLAPDLVVIDVLMNGTDGVDLARTLAARRPTRILGLSVIDEPSRVAQMLRAGAQGFVLKTQPVAEILCAVRTILTGGRYVAPAIRDCVEPLASGAVPLPLERLTPREREIFELLVEGLSNDDIGARLHIAQRTVDTHRHHIMKKLDAHTLGQLVRLAGKWGIA